MEQNPYQSPQEESQGEHSISGGAGYRVTAFLMILVWMMWALFGIFAFAFFVVWLF